MSLEGFRDRYVGGALKFRDVKQPVQKST